MPASGLEATESLVPSKARSRAHRRAVATAQRGRSVTPWRPGQDPESPPSTREVSTTELEALAASAELTDVRVTKCNVELFRDGPLDDVEAELDVTAAYRRRSDGFTCKYSVAAPLSTKAGTAIAKFDVDVIVSFDLDQAPGDLDQLIPPFSANVGFFVAFPFIREALHGMSVRIGLPPLTLGLLRRGSEAPLTATFRTHERS